MTKVNIREALNQMDKDTNCKYDLVTLYEGYNFNDEEKKEIAKMISDNEDADVIYDRLSDKFGKDIDFDDDDISDITLDECDMTIDTEDYVDFEALDEDTVKTSKGKWVNKGEEGTHGTFNTKKEADAQRKAMFASGYKGESLNEGLSPQKGDRVRMNHYSKSNNGQEGTVTGRIGELCWVTWDDGTKSKEIKGYLTVIEREGKVVNESATDSRYYKMVEYTYDGDNVSDYIGHVRVRTNSDKVALRAAEKYAMSKHPEDNPRHFKIVDDNYTNVDVVDSDGDYLTTLESINESKCIKEDINDSDEVLIFKRDVNLANDADEIQLLIYELSDGVAEDNAQQAFNENESNDLETLKSAVITAIDVYLEDNEWLSESKSIKEDRQSDILTIKSNIKDNLVLDNYMGTGKSHYQDYQIELFHDSDNYGGYPWCYVISKDSNILTKKCYGDDLGNTLYSVAQFIYNTESKSIKESTSGPNYVTRDIINKTNSQKLKDAYDEGELEVLINGDVWYTERCPKGLGKELKAEMKRLYPDIKHLYGESVEGEVETRKQNYLKVEEDYSDEVVTLSRYLDVEVPDICREVLDLVEHLPSHKISYVTKICRDFYAKMESIIRHYTMTGDNLNEASYGGAYDMYKKQYKNLLQDIKYVLNSGNIEDIRAYDKEGQGEYILSKLFDSRMNKRNMSFEDAKEDVIDFLYRTRADAKSELELRNKRSLESKSIMNKVKSELSKDYKLVSESENTLYFKAPDNSTHDDCIAFVDKVVAASGGKYISTGRGGSWTLWDILTPGDSYIKAGYDYSNKDNYAVYFKSILTESRSTKSTLKESSYGGAFDIADDEYFTKEDGMIAANEVAYQLEKEFPEAKLEVMDMQLDNHSFYVALTDKDGNEFTEEITLDMRKIRHPLDLIKKYAPALTERFIKQIKDFYSEM